MGDTTILELSLKVAIVSSTVRHISGYIKAVLKKNCQQMQEVMAKIEPDQ